MIKLSWIISILYYKSKIEFFSKLRENKIDSQKKKLRKLTEFTKKI